MTLLFMFQDVAGNSLGLLPPSFPAAIVDSGKYLVVSLKSHNPFWRGKVSRKQSKHFRLSPTIRECSEGRHVSSVISIRLVS